MVKIEIVDGVTTGGVFAKNIDDNFNELTGKTIFSFDVTYSDLVTLMANSGLSVGRSYKITDFATRHYIVDEEGTRYTGITGEITGNLEPLIVTAISNSVIDKEAKSILHPYDIIYYDWNPNNWLNDLSFADAEDTASIIISNFKGVIYFRHDTLFDNYMCYDFRNVKFRRWETNTSGWTSGQTFNVNDFCNYNGFIWTSITSVNTAKIPDYESDYWLQLLDLSYTTYWNNKPNVLNPFTDIPSSTVYADFLTFSEGTGSAKYDLCCRANHFDGLKDNFVYGEANGTLLQNNVFFLQDASIFTVHANRIGQGFAFNTFGNMVMHNTIEHSFYSNRIIDFEHNSIECDFGYNNLNHIYSNSIGHDFSANNIGNDFYNNMIGDSFYSNIIKHDFNNNNISNFCSSNIFGINFRSNFIENNCISNIFGNDCHSNNISTDFYSNVVDSSFNSNSIGAAFLFNTILSYDCKFNSFFNNITNISIFTGGTFENNCVRNNIDFTGVDFSSATHIFLDYNCDIFRNSAGTIRLRYLDGSDIDHIVNPGD